MCSRFLSCLVSIAIPLTFGCSSGPPALRAPEIPRDAGKNAVAKYDSDGDGAIGGAELDKVPALKATLSRADANGDGKVSAEEIDARIAAWKRSQVALSRVVATVNQNGRAVSGATVTLVPEEFLGDAVKAASGTTDSTGSVHLKISDNPDEDGVHLGYYRVEVSRTTPDGKETIPARYNSETQIGKEVTRDDASSDTLLIDIK